MAITIAVTPEIVAAVINLIAGCLVLRAAIIGASTTRVRK